MSDSAKPKSSVRESSTARLVFSFVIALHCVLLSASIFSNQAGSQLISRLANSAIHLSLLGLQNEVPLEFHLSHAMNYEDDHQFVIVVDNQIVARYPDWNGRKFGFQYQRFRNLAHQAAVAVTQEDDVATAEIARGVAAFASAHGHGDRMVVRLNGFIPYDWREDAPLPLAETMNDDFFDTIYEADVWRGSDGHMKVHKRVVASEAAPPVEVSP